MSLDTGSPNPFSTISQPRRPDNYRHNPRFSVYGGNYTSRCSLNETNCKTLFYIHMCYLQCLYLPHQASDRVYTGPQTVLGKVRGFVFQVSLDTVGFSQAIIDPMMPLAIPDSKVHGAKMGPIWGRQDPGGPMLAPWTLLSGISCGIWAYLDIANIVCRLWWG